jgi:hypothetical protein
VVATNGVREQAYHHRYKIDITRFHRTDIDNDRGVGFVRFVRFMNEGDGREVGLIYYWKFLFYVLNLFESCVMMGLYG